MVSKQFLSSLTEQLSLPSIVGSYSSTKWLWINWIVKHDFPTPPPPTTTSLYSRRNYSRPEDGGVSGFGSIMEVIVCHSLFSLVLSLSSVFDGSFVGSGSRQGRRPKRTNGGRNFERGEGTDLGSHWAYMRAYTGTETDRTERQQFARVE